MCGRYCLAVPLERLPPPLDSVLPDGLADHYAPRELIRPGEPVLVLRQEHSRLEGALLLWGLLPDWAKDPLAAPRPFNARSETVAEKASFRAAWRHRRCLLPADAFLEKGRRVERCDGAPFWLAGLWERWIGPDGSEVDSCCVLTTAPNALVAPLHDRMPVIVPAGLEQAWLDTKDGPGLRALEPLLQSWDPEGWRVQPKPREPTAPPPSSQQLPLFS